jgi:hypothetical protein
MILKPPQLRLCVGTAPQGFGEQVAPSPREWAAGASRPGAIEAAREGTSPTGADSNRVAAWLGEWEKLRRVFGDAA